MKTLKKFILFAFTAIFYFLSAAAFADGHNILILDDPVQSKKETCHYLRSAKGILTRSLEEESEPAIFPLYDSNEAQALGAYPVAMMFQAVTTARCSFECVVGQEMCDETLNPDTEIAYSPFLGAVIRRHASGHYDYYKSEAHSCTEEGSLVHEKAEWAIIDGALHKRTTKYYRAETEEDEINIIARNWSDAKDFKDKWSFIFEDNEKDFEDGERDVGYNCKESKDYLVVRDKESGMEREIEIYSEEYDEYQKQLGRAEYQKSCFVPSEKDCRQIAREKQQCMLQTAEELEESLCTSIINPLWIHRQSADKEESVKDKPDHSEPVWQREKPSIEDLSLLELHKPAPFGPEHDFSPEPGEDASSVMDAPSGSQDLSASKAHIFGLAHNFSPETEEIASSAMDAPIHLYDKHVFAFNDKIYTTVWKEAYRDSLANRKRPRLPPPALRK